jgi:DNA polymerase/3'-5' exonuclease PolX
MLVLVFFVGKKREEPKEKQASQIKVSICCFFSSFFPEDQVNMSSSNNARSKHDLFMQLQLCEDRARESKNRFLENLYHALISAVQHISWDTFYDDPEEFNNVCLHFIQYTEQINRELLETVFFPQLLEFFACGTFYINRTCPFQFDSSILKELQTVYGIGATKAEELLNKLHIDSIPALKKRVGMLSSILTESQAVALEHHDDLKQPIPREEIDALCSKFEEIAGELETQIFITGSYRRGAATCKNVDILIEEKYDPSTMRYRKLHLFHSKMITAKWICATIAITSERIIAVGRVTEQGMARRWNISGCPLAKLPFKLLFTTGDIAFNKELQRIAMLRHMVLTSDNLYTRVTQVGMTCESINVQRALGKECCTTEEDILLLLGLKKEDLPLPSARDRKAGVALRIKVEKELGIPGASSAIATTTPIL